MFNQFSQAQLKVSRVLFNDTFTLDRDNGNMYSDAWIVAQDGKMEINAQPPKIVEDDITVVLDGGNETVTVTVNEELIELFQRYSNDACTMSFSYSDDGVVFHVDGLEEVTAFVNEFIDSLYDWTIKTIELRNPNVMVYELLAI